MDKKIKVGITGMSYADLLRNVMSDQEVEQLLNAQLDRSSRGFYKRQDRVAGFSKHINAPRSNPASPPLTEFSSTNGKTINGFWLDEWT